MNERPINCITYFYIIVKMRLRTLRWELQLLVYVFLPYLSNLYKYYLHTDLKLPLSTIGRVVRLSTSFSVGSFVQNRSKTKILLTINSIIKKLFLNLNMIDIQMLLFHIHF